MTTTFRIAGLAMALTCITVAASAEPLTFSISFPAARSVQPLDGRVILLLSPREGVEPRTLVESDKPLQSPYLFGVQVAGLKHGAPAVIDGKVFGWPAANLSAIAPGDYT